jgi:pyruvate ferredoxin oxidoreductase alpha subunit
VIAAEGYKGYISEKNIDRQFGRRYRQVEVYGSKDADLAIITNGTLAGTVKAYIRQGGADKKVGLIKMRFFRPFPAIQLRQAVKGFKKAIVVDRNLSPGGGGIFAQEIKSALYATDAQIPVVSVIGGLGGVDVYPEHLDRLVDRVRMKSDAGSEPVWLEA